MGKTKYTGIRKQGFLSEGLIPKACAYRKKETRLNAGYDPELKRSSPSFTAGITKDAGQSQSRTVTSVLLADALREQIDTSGANLSRIRDFSEMYLKMCRVDPVHFIFYLIDHEHVFPI